MDLSWYALTSLLQVKLSNTLKSKDLAILAFQKKFQTHPLKLAEVEPSFRDQPTPCKTT